MTFDPSLLAGLDDVAWDLLDHAYGPATDVPVVLRALASGDDEQAEDAVYELFGNVWHQGSVYPATIPAVPFLVAIAAGKQTSEVLRLLGYIAGSSDPRGIQDRDAPRSAVAAHVHAVAGLLGDAAAKVRAGALFVLVHAAPSEVVRPLIVERWHAEIEALPRAEALNAMMRVDPDAAADLADEVLAGAGAGAGAGGGAGGSSDEAVLLVSCALAWVHAGRAMDERVLAAALAPIPEGSELWYWNDDGELFDQFINELAARQGVQASVELLVEALDRAGGAPTELVFRYLGCAMQLIVSYRSAQAGLAAPIARLLARPVLGHRVISVLELIDPAVVASMARDGLVELVQASAEAGPKPELGSEPELDPELDPEPDAAYLADDALACLARWGDPIVPALLARALAERPRALSVVAEPGVALAFDADLLAAIRRRLNEICDAAQEPPAESGNPFATAQNRNEPVQLLKILSEWGDRAAPALPELVRLLPVRPVVVAPLVAALRPPSLEGMARLRRIAATADGGDAVRERLAAARAVRVLTDDSGPLLAAVRCGLTTESKDPDDRGSAAVAATELPEHAEALVPLLLRALAGIPVPTPSLPAHQARIHLGRALWLLSGQPDHAIDVLRSTLALAGEMFTAWTVATAAEAAADLGPAARELVPALEPALADAVSCPAAAHALLTIDPDGPWSTTRREELADLLFGVLVESTSSKARSRAVDVLATLAPLSAGSVEKARALAGRDERFPIGVLDAEHLRGDELLQVRLRGLISE